MSESSKVTIISNIVEDFYNACNYKYSRRKIYNNPSIFFEVVKYTDDKNLPLTNDPQMNVIKCVNRYLFENPEKAEKAIIQFYYYLSKNIFLSNFCDLFGFTKECLNVIHFHNAIKYSCLSNFYTEEIIQEGTEKNFENQTKIIQKLDKEFSCIPLNYLNEFNINKMNKLIEITFV